MTDPVTLSSPVPPDFRMRKSAELLRESAELTALIEVAGQRLADVCAELTALEGRIALDPRFGVGTWFTAYEQALSSYPRRLSGQDLSLRASLLQGLAE